MKATYFSIIYTVMRRNLFWKLLITDSEIEEISNASREISGHCQTRMIKSIP